MVSKARLDFPEPERPVMQISRFRGNRTVMSLRLCSRAPWTTSSSAAISGESSARTGVRTEAPIARASRKPSLAAPRAPAAEQQAAEGEAEPEGAEREGADRDRLPPVRHLLPAAERLLFLGRQRLAAALLAQRAAGAQAEVEVLDDLGGLVHHCFEFIGWVGRVSADSARLR